MTLQLAPGLVEGVVVRWEWTVLGERALEVTKIPCADVSRPRGDAASPLGKRR
ncbi:hypothetical protein [Sorangium sp. So ce1153]|uniref:hypothetical protein n=1 Tax=Sorangium sp. So ce1153 TaxID=3133333 RepID=UPI003F5E9FEB